MVIGKNKKTGKMETQSLRFDRGKWSASETMKWLDKNNYKLTKSDKLYASIFKADTEKRVAIGVVLSPEEFDAHNDIISAEEIEKTAYDYMEESRTINIQHGDTTERVHIVESYIAPDNMKIGEEKIKKGSWVMGVRIHDDEIWKSVKSGEITGFSIGGYGIKNVL